MRGVNLSSQWEVFSVPVGALIHPLGAGGSAAAGGTGTGSARSWGWGWAHGAAAGLDGPRAPCWPLKPVNKPRLPVIKEAFAT